MGLFSKKKLETTLTAPIDGQLIPLEKVQDSVFSQKMMGDGFAVEPSDDKIVSPVSGTVESIFPTKHALMIQSKRGLEIMVHLGIDTVELNGEPFEIEVKKGDQIEQGSAIGEMDIDAIKAKQKLPTVIVIVSNMDQVKNISEITPEQVSAGKDVQTIQSK
ncbi:PTS sugar transporter subunit IIA [Companilactobacillus sp.]|jgi:PTS system glucose-specific IIA component|uniref:PTS sugar transporter subunit IIA n=1 Tax=Companilactobacillus sp. TaxID=2767905 RepID=UPI0025BF9DBE|nr:PTS glucose transporter subunit IIA [Companilactobacillus sp.]MCH4008281.1 PTS glucose transporter subunit IIA [Companilactobacillus sp.]MCH4051540.1 PTS glucose transporter subunit IIA [Companilactobacillus sp.]MCH4076224.1 PTS glucose transporter subunit IIA [Companilactobacillus sp.]MCH4124799.1 PTS glucose transporter subunit IIA [Companilactobacillus sp.]MCH4131341.1 PTS glucose transporter subunit IIA [Companilactobacillus sp.]